jgi:S1-C subfamily serine protease
MNEQPLTPPSAGTTLPRRPRRKRRLILPAAVAALALGAVGTGVGYAAANQSSSATGSTAVQGTTSTQVLQPTYGGGDWAYGGGQYYVDPDQSSSPYGGYSYDDGGQSSGGQSSGDQSSGGQSSDGQSSGTSSTDTTSKAAGSQLTGLVRIATTLKYDGGKAAGTGMVVTSDGEVITNHHVVAGATSIKVTVMSTGKTYTAKVIGTDATDDVAVLQLSDASGLDTVTTDTGAVSTGDAVTAVGDGNGTVGYLSAATGSVMATDQSITTQAEGSAASEKLTDLIEISSDVVAGFSGGATYDSDGEVVGMTTAASSGSSDVVGYAIPISKVLSIADDLESGTTGASYTYGYPAFLGIALGTSTTVQGVYDGTPADDAGIAGGSSITSVGGIATTTATQLQAAIASHSPGDSVKITWTDASGSSHSATVTLARGPVA